MATQDLIILRWEPPTDTGGTPILGYKLYMKRAIETWNLDSPYYEGKEDPVTRLMYITTYNGAPLVQSETYQFMTKSRNWVGWSPNSPVFDVNIPYKVSPANCQVTGNGLTPSDTNIDASVDATITVLAKYIDVNGLVQTKPLPPPAQNYEDIFFLHVLDRCAMPLGNYFCEETADSSNILKPPQMHKITYYDSLAPVDKNGYIATYQVKKKGIATLDVITLYQGGLKAEYWNNAFLDGVPAITREDFKVDFDWGLGLITNEVADFVSIRWSGKVRAPATEDFTFILHADDAVRMWINEVLKIDRWDSCCEDVAVTVPLVMGTYTDLRIEYKEYQEQAYVKLYWTSQSVPK
jgi:hypothetical protein